MALQTATNPETGERVAFVNGQWLPITETATNPNTGSRVGLINNQWLPIPGRPVVQEEPTPEPEAVQDETPADQSFLREVADVPLKLAGGVTTGVRLIADAFGADSDVSKNLRGAEEWISKLYSAQSKQDSQEVQSIMQAAEDQGVGDQVIAGLKAFTVAPIDMVVNALGTSAPAIVAGLLSIVSAPVGAAAVLGAGALMGAGTIKGAIYDATKEILSEQGGISPEQIEAAAIKAQEYGGENLDQILLGAGVGAIAGRTGAETSIIRQLSKSILGRAAATEAGEVTAEAAARAAAVAAATKKIAERGMKKQAGITAATELGTEGFQGGQEQFAANLAQQRQGFDTPLMRGVVGQGTLEGLAGAGLGAVTGARESMSASNELARDEALSGELDPTDQQKLLTVEEEGPQRKGFDEDTAAALKATDESGVKSDDVEVTELNQLQTTYKETEEYLAKEFKNGVGNASKLKGIINNINKLAGKEGEPPPITMPETGEVNGVKFAVRAQEAIKAHLATRGETDAAGTDTGAAGTGADVAGQAGVNEATTSAPEVRTGRVDDAGADVGGPPAGDGSQLDPLSLFSADEIYGKFDPNTYLGGTKAGEEVNLDKLFPAVPTDAPTTTVVDPAAPANAPVQLVKTTSSAWQGNGFGTSSADWAVKGAEHIQVEKVGLFWRATDTRAGKVLVRRADTRAEAQQQLAEMFAADPKLLEAKKPEPKVAPTTTVVDTENQKRIKDRKDKIFEMIAEGEDADKITRHIETLNKFEAANGFEPSTYSNILSARIPKGEVKAARYRAENLPEDAEERYEAARQKVNAEVDREEAQRAQLVQNVEDSGAEVDRLVDELTELEVNTSPEVKLTEAYKKQVADLESKLSQSEADLATDTSLLKTQSRKRTKLKPWYQTDAAEKDILFGKIVYKNDADSVEIDSQYEAAGRALQEYRTKRGVEKRETGVAARSAEELEQEAGEKRLANAYDENRTAAGRILEYVLPAWSSLSEEAKSIFRKANTGVRSKTGKTVYSITGEQQDAGFMAVGEHLIQIEGKNQKYSPAVQSQRRRQIIKRLKEQRANLQEIKELQARFNRQVQSDTKVRTALPNSVIIKIQNGQVNQAIEAFIDSLKSRAKEAKLSTTENIQLRVAEALLKLNLKTTISIAVDPMPDNDLGQYDSVVDHVTLSATGGVTPKIFLHELVHAATVQVLDHYLNGRLSRLTAGQIAGAKQIVSLMQITKPVLARSYPEAYENPYEFVSYAITDEEFANALRNLDISTPSLEKWYVNNVDIQGVDIGSILPKERTLWSSFKQSIANILGIPKGAMKSTNFLLEMHAAFEDILTAPTEPVYVSNLAAKKPPKVVEKGEEPQKVATGGLFDKDPNYIPARKIGVAGQLWRRLTTTEGWKDTITEFQDATYRLDAWQKTRTMTGQINFDMSGGYNNVATQNIRAMAEGRNFVTEYLQSSFNKLQEQLSVFSKKHGMEVDGEVLPLLQKLGEMFHDPERRRVNFIFRVGLRTDKNLTHNGKKISAADRRIQLVGDENTGREGLIHRVDLDAKQLQDIRTELDFLADNYADSNGYGPVITEELVNKWSKMDPAEAAENKKSLLKESASEYVALGVPADKLAERQATWAAMKKDNPEMAEELEAIFKTLKALTIKQKELDSKGNYWSRPVTNLVGIYGYEHYLPYQGFNEGRPKRNSPDAMGAEYQTTPRRAVGRQEGTTVASNPVLQLLANSVRAAGRAGRRHYTQSIYNAVSQGIMPGIIDPNGPITFMQRQADPSIMDKYKGANKNTIMHYNHDGSIDIIRINDLKLLDAMRQTYKADSMATDVANAVTGFFGAMHTRYNYNFAPVNFVRDTLTNTWNIGASGDMGPVEATKYIKYVSTAVAKNGLGKAWEVAWLHERADSKSRAELAALAQKDPFVKNMLEMMQYGGKTTYLEFLSKLSALAKLEKAASKTVMLRTEGSITGFFDAYNYAFEFTSRTAAYMLKKEGLKKKFIADGMAAEKAEVAAATEAAAFTKNLANFEKIGTNGRVMGGLFMFFRPSVTGAVRAAQAALPGMPFSEKIYVNNLPADVKADEKLKAKYLESFRKDRKNARIMIGGLTGAGMAIYYMAAAMSPDDDKGRNNVKFDNMQQWTRYARFHISKDLIIQIPWGFGLGAFMAAGAQMASMVSGPQSIKDGLTNIVFSIMADSFMPLPISRMSPTDYPLAFVADSIAPTALRPIIEFAMNRDGLGRNINSAFQRRMGDAYTGGDRINEAYKNVAQYFYEATDGAIDVSPNSMYFFVNSYIDGVGKFAELITSSALLAQGNKAFNPKTDVPLIGSFIGAKSNVDSREYGQIEQQIKNIDSRISSLLKNSPANYARFITNNPTYEAIVELYKAGQGELNAIREKMTNIRTDKNLTPKEKEGILKVYLEEQNLQKYVMVLQFKSLGLKP
jgi:hypothetical protein